MKFYGGYAIFAGEIKQTNGQPAVAIVIKVKDERGMQDGMVVSVHPDDVPYVKAALQCMSAVGTNVLSEAMVKTISHDGLIVLPTNGEVIKVGKGS